MAYIGRGTDKLSNIEKLDVITFDGSSSYTLQKNSVNFTPNSANSLQVSIDGVVQAGNFTVSGSTIDFGVAIPSTSTCDFIFHYGTGLITTPADGTVDAGTLSTDAITGQTEDTTPADDDLILTYDTSASALKKVQKSNFASPAGLTLIKEVDASNVSAVTFQDGTDSVVFDTTYKVYFMTITNLFMVSDEELFLRILSGGTVQTGSTAYWTAQYGTAGVPALPSAYSDRYENAIWGSPGDVESTVPLSGNFYIYNVGQTSAYPQVMGQIFMQRSNGNTYGMNFNGWYKTAISNFDGISLTNNGGGNISSGNFKLYGLK